MPEHQNPRDRGLASRRATAATLITFLAVGMAAVWLATDDAVSQADEAGIELEPVPREAGVGACLNVAYPRSSGQWAGVDILEHEAAAHDHLFPALETVTVPPRPLDRGMIVALWPNGAPSPGEAAMTASRGDEACATADSTWALRITRELLADGADRLLERATFGEDWTATIDVSLHPGQSRVRTRLDFSGPFGVKGSCWIDETFAIDLQTGLPEVISSSENDAGLAGLVACRRFEKELAGGGAGAQALALLPSAVTDGSTDPTLALSRIEVTDGMVTLSGTTR
jgi:hypothetical protein